MKTMRIISLLLALAMVMAMLPMVSGRARAEVTLSGSGTTEDPYRIGSKEQLKKFRNIVNGSDGETKNTSACAVLTADIDLENESWIPIGYFCSYSGVFDGCGFSIIGLYVFKDVSYVGLFGSIERANIKNLAVSGTVIVSSSHSISAGGLAGFVNDSTIERCSYIGDVSGTVENYSSEIGGLVGSIYDSTMRDCMSSGNLSSNTNSYYDNLVGGIAGSINFLNNGIVERCYSTANVRSDTGMSSYVGGFAGAIINRCGVIQNCYCKGTLTSVQGSIGGFSGCIDGLLDNCLYIDGYQPYTGTQVTYEYIKNPANFTDWDGWFMGADGPKLWAIDAVEVSTWSELYEALQINGNGIRLISDVTCGTGSGDFFNARLVVPYGVSVTLDLNGYTINRNLVNSEAVQGGDVLCINGDSLTLIDSRTGGTITGGNKSGVGGGVSVGSGSFRMFGGIISGNISSYSGGGVSVANGSFYMYGGTITNNIANNNVLNDQVYYGGGVYVEATNCIYLSGNATVTGNKVLSKSSELISNVFLNSFTTSSIVTVLGPLSDKTVIGIQMEKPGVFTSGLNCNSDTNSNGSLSNFFSDDPAYTIAPTDSGELRLISTGSISFSGRVKLDGRPLSDGDVFKFEVTENGTVVATGQSDENGKISFSEIVYDYSDIDKQHLYTVKQCATDINGVAIDKTELTVYVIVSYIQGDDRISVIPSEEFSNLCFTNTYTKEIPKYTLPEDLKAVYGQTLADVTLPDGWKWDDSATTSVGDAGENYFSATYTPADTVYYFAVTEKLMISVSKASAPKELTSAQKPIAIEGLFDTGAEQALLSAPKTLPEGYTIEYSADGSNWTKTIPTGKEAGEYKVQTRYVGDKNHESFSGETVTVIIKAVYTVIWLDGNGAELDKIDYVEGSTEPTTNKTPTKANADSSYFVFAGWDNGTVEGTTKKYTPSFTKKPLYTSEVGTLEYTMGENKEAIVRIIGNQNNTGLVGRVKTIGTDTKKAVFGTDVLLKEGSLIITFVPGYLDSLGAGEHMIRVVFDDGEVSFLARILAPIATATPTPTFTPTPTLTPTPVPVDSTPVTGDTVNPFLFAALISLSMAGFAVMLEKRRKKA